MAMSTMSVDGMMAAGYPNLVKGRAVQEAEGLVFNEVSAKGLERGRATMNARGYVGLAKGRETEKARGSPGLTKTRATQKVTGSSQLAKGIAARKAKSAAEYARTLADRAMIIIFKTSWRISRRRVAWIIA
jgi:hypothetical protein